MKKVIFFLLLTLLINLKTNAQSPQKWADSAAVWHHTYNAIGIVGYQKSIYINDTIIYNKHCQIINTEYQQAFLPLNPPLIPGNVFYLGRNIFNKSNDSIFIFQNNNFRLAFKINSVLGEIWNLGEVYPNSGNVYVKVDSIYNETYNGVVLKNIHVFACNEQGDSLFNNSSGTEVSYISKLTYINEKFGPIGGFGDLDAVPNVIIDETLPQFYLCYESSTFPLYQFSNVNCFNDILTNEYSLSENEKQFFVYPNPANETLNISNSNLISSYEIFQLDRKLLNQGNNFPIDISKFTNGIYFLKITTKNNQIINQKIIKQ
jgi:hypothetical protein